MNDRSPRDLALRALRDCGVIRASWDRSVFADLVRDGYARAREVPGPHGYGRRDYALTAAGHFRAGLLKPWAETARPKP